MREFFRKMSRTLGGDRAMNLITQSSDLILACFIIILIMMIIIPISPEFLDNLIAINLIASITLLMVALYIPRAVNLSIFPTLLLITTLSRGGIE